MSSLRRSLRFVLDGLVPVVGAKTTRHLLEMVVAYLHDSTGLIAMIEKAHQVWKNPAVTESLAARSHEHHAAIQAACRERLQNRQRALSPFSRVSVPTYFLLLLFHLYLFYVVCNPTWLVSAFSMAFPSFYLNSTFADVFDHLLRLSFSHAHRRNSIHIR